MLIASQIATTELGIDFPQEVDYKPIYSVCSVFCEAIYSATEARRMATRAAQMALTRRGVSVLVVPSDIAALEVEDESGYAVHRAKPVTRPSDSELDDIAAILNEGGMIGDVTDLLATNFIR